MSHCECQMPDAWSVDYISSHWRKLEEQSRHHTIFQSWAWLDCWLEIAKKHIRPIIFKDNGKVVGICFIGTGKTYDLKIIGIPTIFPFLSGHQNLDIVTPEYSQILCLPEYKDSLYKDLIHFLVTDKRFTKYKRISLTHISQSNLSEYQKTAEDIGYSVNIYKKVRSALVDFEPIRSQNLHYDEHFSKSLKNEISRSEKLYTQKYGTLKLEKPGNVTQAHNWFQELGKLNKSRFEKKNLKSAWDYPDLLCMHRAFLNRQFSCGTADIIRLCAGTTPIGYLYNFIYRGVVYFYMCGFRFEDDNKFKPGILTHYYALDYYFKKNLKSYDFMAGDQPYKYRMATDTSDVFYLTITKKDLKFKIISAFQSLKNFLKGEKPQQLDQSDLPPSDLPPSDASEKNI